MKTRIGHAHLKVRNLPRAITFYETFLGMRLREQIGNDYAFLSGSDLHHEIALQNVGGSAPMPPIHATGLYHVAFEVENEAAFVEAYHALKTAGVDVRTVDHRISWAMYFNDPDGNGLEIYWDTRNEPEGVELWDGVNVPIPAEKLQGAESNVKRE